jgi:hypothetical protein
MDKEICCFIYQLLDDLFTLVRGESRDYQLEGLVSSLVETLWQNLTMGVNAVYSKIFVYSIRTIICPRPQKQ